MRPPAVPRAGKVIYVDPYSDELRVHSVTWTVDPDNDEPAVSLHISDVAFDVIGNDDDTLDAFLASGWTAED